MENNDIRKAWETVVLPEDFEGEKTLITYKGDYLSESKIDAPLSPITLAEISNNQTNDAQTDATDKEQKVANTQTETSRYAQPSTLSSCDYTLDKEIARGGMGVVFRGHQTSLKRDVAIKKILAKKSQESSKDKFIAESLVTAYLDHPNIVPVYELGESESGDVLLTMKLVKGCSWRDLLHPKNTHHKKLAQKYDQEKHLRILLSVCNAIAFAHSKGIVHNDLKPANIMVGEFGEILVMDWGIAIDIGKETENLRTIHKSMLSVPMGTPGYMPAELAEGRGGDLGPWTDVYLLGAILYEIVMKKPPHTGTLMMALASSVMGKAPCFTSNVPQELQDICKKALDKNTVQRYQSVLKFQQALEGYLEHHQSIVICDKAFAKLRDTKSKTSELTATKGGLYQDFAQIIFGFEQALELWSQNKNAQLGKEEAHLCYAKSAVDWGDLGLAKMQLQLSKSKTEEFTQIQEKIEKIQKDKLYQQKKAQRIEFGLKAAIVIIACGLLLGIFLVKKEQLQTKQAHQKIKEAKDQAIKQLALVALSKSHDAYKAKDYNRCGSYGAKALAFSKDIKDHKQRENLSKQAHSLVKLALYRRPLIKSIKSKAQSIAFHSSGNYVAAIEQKEVYLWDIKNKKQLLHKSFKSKVNALAFSLKTLAFASGTKVYIWHLQKQKIIRTLEHSCVIYSIAYSPNEEILATGDLEKKVGLWFKSKAKPEFLTHNTWPDQDIVEFRIRRRFNNGPQMQQMQMQTQRKASNPMPFSDKIRSVHLLSFSPNGKYMATADFSGALIWDLSKRKRVAMYKARAITALAYSPGGEKIAFAQSNSVKLWDIQRASLAKEFDIKEHINAVVFSPDGDNLVIATEQGNIKVYKSNNVFVTEFKNARSVLGLCATKNTLASCDQRAIKIWDMGFYQKPKSVYLKMPQMALKAHAKRRFMGRSHRKPKNMAILSPDGKMVACYYNSQSFGFGKTKKKKEPKSTVESIYLYKANSGKKVFVLKGHSDKVTSLTFSLNGKILASCAKDKSICLWQVDSGKKLATFNKEATMVALASDEYLAFAKSNQIETWINAKKQTHKFKADVLAMAFSSDHQMLAVIDKDGIVYLWQIATNTFSKESTQISPLTVCFSPDNKFLVLCGENAIILQEIKSGKKTVLKSHESPHILTFSKGKAQKMASASSNEVVLWDMTTQKKLISYPNYLSGVSALAFSKDSEKLYILDKNNLLSWNVIAAKLADPDVQRHLKKWKKTIKEPHVNIEKIAEEIFALKVTKDLSVTALKE